MKVAIISPYSIRSVSGAGRYISDLCKEFNVRKIDFILMVPSVPDPMRLINIFTRGENFFEIPNPEIKFLQNAKIMISTFKLLLKSRNEIDIINIFTINSVTAGVTILARIMNKPVVTTVFVLPPLPEPLLKREIRKLAVSIVIKSTDNFVYETALARTQCGNRPGIIVPGGTDTDYFKFDGNFRQRIRRELKFADDDFVLLYSGRLVESKGLVELLEAVESLPEDILNRFKLVLIGKIESAGLKKLVNRFRNRQWFLYHGPVGRDNIKKFYSCADSFVLPSYYEGISSSLLEAMATGLPSIVTNVGGNIEVVINKKNGLVVEPGKPGELKYAIELLYNDTSLRKRLSAAARSTVVRKFNLHNKSAQYIKLFKMLLDRNSDQPK